MSSPAFQDFSAVISPSCCTVPITVNMATATVIDSRYLSMAALAACMGDLENICWQLLWLLPTACGHPGGRPQSEAAAATKGHWQHANVPGDLRRRRRTFSSSARQWPFHISQNTNAYTRHH